MMMDTSDFPRKMKLFFESTICGKEYFILQKIIRAVFPENLVQLVEIKENIANFPWQIIIDISLNSSDNQSLFLKIGNLRENINNQLKHIKINYLIADSFSYSTCMKTHDGSNILIAYYDWAPRCSTQEREQLIKNHFEAEKKQDWFNKFVFNIHLLSNFNINFLFEGFFENDAALARMRADPALEQLKQNASKFIDESTKKIAKGLHWNNLKDYLN